MSQREIGHVTHFDFADHGLVSCLRSSRNKSATPFRHYRESGNPVFLVSLIPARVSYRQLGHQNSFGKPACLRMPFAVWQDRILFVYWEIAVRYGTVPNLVIAFALAVKVTPVRPENPLHVGRVVCHLVAE